MKIIRGQPPKPHKIVCTGCGEPALEAGVAVSYEIYELAFGPDGDQSINEDDMTFLCESCVTALERADARR